MSGGRSGQYGTAPVRWPRVMTFGVDTLPPDRHAEFNKRLADIDTKFPQTKRANVQDFVDQIDYAVKKIGIDHVGISSDFDGSGGIDG
jgi:membrane dipeptidase